MRGPSGSSIGTRAWPIPPVPTIRTVESLRRRSGAPKPPPRCATNRHRVVRQAPRSRQHQRRHVLGRCRPVDALRARPHPFRIDHLRLEERLDPCERELRPTDAGDFFSASPRPFGSAGFTQIDTSARDGSSTGSPRPCFTASTKRRSTVGAIATIGLVLLTERLARLMDVGGAAARACARFGRLVSREGVAAHATPGARPASGSPRRRIAPRTIQLRTFPSRYFRPFRTRMRHPSPYRISRPSSPAAILIVSPSWNVPSSSFSASSFSISRWINRFKGRAPYAGS